MNFPQRPPPNFIQRLLLRYPYQTKINFIAGLLGFIILFLSYELISWQRHEINFAKKELIGNQYKSSIYQLMDLITMHHIYNHRALDQDKNAVIKLTQLQEHINAKFISLINFNQSVQNKLQTSREDFQLREQSKSYPPEIENTWKNLLKNHLSSSAETNQYTMLIRNLQALLNYISDSSNLSYDPEIETHYLIEATIKTLPHEKELISGILILGDKINSKSSLSSEDIFQMTTLVSLLLSSLDETEENINKSIIQETNFNEHLDTKNLLSQPAANYSYAVHNFTDNIKKLFLTDPDNNPFTPSQNEKDQQPIPSAAFTDFFNLGASAIQKNNELYETLSDQTEKLLNFRVSAIRSEQIEVIAIIFISLAIALISGYSTLCEANFFFRHVYTAMMRFSGGELSARAPVSYDKAFENMRGMLNELADRIENLIAQLQHSGARLTTTTTQIADAAKHQEATLCQQEATVKQILVTAGEISSTAKEFAKTMNDVSISAEETSALASYGRDGLNKMEQTMRHMVEASKNIASKLAVLSEKAGAITSVITTITKVADQTNLLSLNASIEAEKAGEHGKSFAVIAREIRRLADQTANATLDIEQMVSEMMSAVSEGVMGVDKFSEEIHTGVDQISTASEQLSKIIEGVQHQTARYENVNRGMQAQSFGAEQINESIMQLSDAAQETTTSIRQFHAAIDQLTIATKEMQVSVTRMKK